MAGARNSTDPPLITSAARSRTLDVDERERRYVITMSIRTACFLAFLVVPGWWKVVALCAAAFLPLVAVVLANNSDHRPPPLAAEPDESRPALPASDVIVGVVEDDE
ncbi:DUF3099 domain-containing protein [Tessaracoccus sp. OS52]|uniref:DUF3099 domain-containing protein n=1 Tax=Tessaracoccus sp. OS52 TaxID=2886691 RepID=UPI001D10CEC5|nr:DUF3099 domain-containing protein [Tessaracoccus sp. OS52]MCC2593326.1 DUF3099 domain-containing protein [Tessaracoccus sp. OS52]